MENEEMPNLENIEDVRLIVKINGKHHAINPLEGVDREDAKTNRVAALSFLLKTHSIIVPSLEEIREAQ